MSNTLWKPMPGYAGYEINRKGWVRNLRGYVVASGKGICLSVEGVKASLSRKRLVELAAEAFGTANSHVSASELKPMPEPSVEPLPPNVDTSEQGSPPRTQEAAEKSLPRSHNESNGSGGLRIKPTHILTLRDPWENGTIAASSHWDLAGVM